MEYSQSLRYLNSFLNLERISFAPNNRLWNLERMRLLLKWFGHPERAFFPIVIAGTKGKGSTGFFLESILQAAGINTGFYSSPHLEDARERIRIAGRWVSKRDWTNGLEQIKKTLARQRLPQGTGEITYFEIMTLLAVLCFRQAKVRIGIFEVGMGGRLDATNTMNAMLVILTSIGFDHEAFLGNTLAAIAGEKAAIIRPGADVVTVQQKASAKRVIYAKAKRMGARLWPALVPPPGWRLGLEGGFQKMNAGCALRAAAILQSKHGFQISERAKRAGIAGKSWPGRMERLKGEKNMILDGAHNPASTQALVRHLAKEYPRKKRSLIFGTTCDKKSAQMLKTLSTYFDEIILTRAKNPRSKEVLDLITEARPLFKKVYATEDLGKALEIAKIQSSKESLSLVTGSFYLVGEARSALNARH